MLHPHSGLAASAPSATSGARAAQPSSIVVVENFQLNILNRQKPDKDLWVYIEARDAKGNLGFLVPPPADKPGEVASWFLPGGPAPGRTAAGDPIVNPELVAPEKIGFKLDKNTGGEGGKPPVRSMMLPSYIESGRVYLSEEELDFYSYQDPQNLPNILIAAPSVLAPPSNKTSFGFVELTWRSKGDDLKARGLWTNLSFVDWVGVVLGMSVKEHGETNVVKQKIPGLKETSEGVLNQICDSLAKASKKAGNFAWWTNLCVRDPTGKPLRVVSPNLYLSMGGVGAANQDPEQQFYKKYIDDVWAKFAQTPLKVDTQIYPTKTALNWTEGAGSTGAVCECKTQPGFMECGGQCLSLASDNFNDWATPLKFARPSDIDIFSCNSGPFAHKDSNKAWAQIRARLCAGFVRSTLLLDDTTPSVKVREDQYYLNEIHDYYSETVHKNLAGNRGYTFSFDDVNPGEDNSAGVIEMTAPVIMNIVAGGWKDGDELYEAK